MNVTDIVAVVLAHIGAFFMLVAAIGLVRMPEVLMRLHCTAKSATLGVGFLLIAAALGTGTLPGWARALAAVAFFLVTAPVGAHILGRAALSRDPMPVQHPDDGSDRAP